MNKQEINNLKAEFNELTARIIEAKSITEDLEKKAEDIKKQLEDAEKKATDGKLREWWVPVKDEQYFCVGTSGNIIRTFWQDDYYDHERLLFGNVFKTEEEAKFERERRKVYFELKKYVYEHDPRPITKKDWKDYDVFKYYITYWCDCDEIIIEYNNMLKLHNTIYASNRETLKDAIKAIGEDRIKKYLFEVE